MYNNKVHLLFIQRCTKVYNIPRRHLPLLCIGWIFKRCEVSNSQRQKRSKRLFLKYMSAHLPLHFKKKCRRWAPQSYKILFGKENIDDKKSKIYEEWYENVLMFSLKCLFVFILSSLEMIDFFENAFLGTSPHKNPPTSIHSCHHPSTPNESADNGWQDSCNRHYSPATGA